MTTSSERESDRWMRRRSPRTGHSVRRTLASAVTAGLLVALLAATPAHATPADSAPGTPAVNLRLDGRAAGRLLAASDSDSLEGGDKSADAKGEGEGAAKSDDMKLTVTRGDGQKKKPADSGDSLAFLKDWPFWAIVGGVVLAGAATFMIVENHNQKHACGAVYDAGCFGAK